METINALGRRKAAVARVFVREGKGNIVINKRGIDSYFPSGILQYIVKQPLAKLDVVEKYDIQVNLNGGGFKGQAEALRLAIAARKWAYDPPWERWVMPMTTQWPKASLPVWNVS